MSSDDNYKVKKYSPIRQILADFNDEAARSPHIQGLLEVDVTEARNIIKEYEEKHNYRISLTGWVLYCIANAVKEHERLNSFLKGSTKIIIFENVDISVMIERKTKEGKIVPYNHVVRKAETKTVKEITDEVRISQEKELEDKDFIRGSSGALVLYRFIPRFIRRYLMRKKLKNPFYLKKTAGTVGLTSLGPFVKTLSGWAVPLAIKTLNVALGGIREKPAIVDGKIVKREFLGVAYLINHNIVDGAPAARFITHSIELMESASGLSEEDLK